MKIQTMIFNVAPHANYICLPAINTITISDTNTSWLIMKHLKKKEEKNYCQFIRNKIQPFFAHIKFYFMAIKSAFSNNNAILLVANRKIPTYELPLKIFFYFKIITFLMMS